ncbi:hypothetical protein QAD02_012831 [Eretmocerus hayati]|uniref:Uncharacterized protein n=1 Tax=Eretmocerus hayati TaxID=131215 RepID=A0ACC2P3D3_9HYME|nr:hypothetical protein QAD02_012831 [Eretmocerus hayati]
MEGLPELSDWELEIGSSMGDDDETSLDRFVTAITGQNDGLQAMGMNTAEGTGPSHDMGQLDFLLEGFSSQNLVETGNQEAVTFSSSGNQSEPTRRDFCTPLDIGGLQIQGGEATMPAESTTGGPVVIELDSPEPTPGTSQGTCRPRGRMSMVKRLNACLKKGNKILARGDAIINARNSLMTAERAECSARAEAILLANTQVLQDGKLVYCVSSFKLAPKLSWEGNMELHTVDEK